MTYVAPRTLFRLKVIVVLRNRGFEHRRPEVRGIAQVFRPGVVGKKGEAVLITAADVDVASVIPTLRRVLEKIYRAHRETHGSGRAARRRRHIGYAVRQRRIRDKCNLGERPPRTNGAGSRQSVVDQVRALQVNAVRAKITDLDGSVVAKTLLDRGTPLLDVL